MKVKILKEIQTGILLCILYFVLMNPSFSQLSPFQVYQSMIEERPINLFTQFKNAYYFLIWDKDLEELKTKKIPGRLDSIIQSNSGEYYYDQSVFFLERNECSIERHPTYFLKTFNGKYLYLKDDNFLISNKKEESTFEIYYLTTGKQPDLILLKTAFSNSFFYFSTIEETFTLSEEVPSSFDLFDPVNLIDPKILNYCLKHSIYTLLVPEAQELSLELSIPKDRKINELQAKIFSLKDDHNGVELELDELEELLKIEKNKLLGLQEFHSNQNDSLPQQMQLSLKEQKFRIKRMDEKIQMYKRLKENLNIMINEASEELNRLKKIKD